MPELPFAHSRLPALLRTPSGLSVPCSGPHGLALNHEDQPVCADCLTPVHRIADETLTPPEQTLVGLMECLASHAAAPVASPAPDSPSWFVQTVWDALAVITADGDAATVDALVGYIDDPVCGHAEVVHALWRLQADGAVTAEVTPDVPTGAVYAPASPAPEEPTDAG